MLITAIRDLRTFAAKISSAIEEQSAATAGIAENTQLAAKSSRLVVGNSLELNGQAGTTYAASNEVLEATKHLLDLTHDVRSNVDKFIQHVRCA